MPTKFDWQTDEEAIWQNGSNREKDTAVSTSFFTPKRVYLGLGALAILTLALVVAYSQIGRRVAATTSGFKADVLAAHQLLQETAVADDEDLFQALLLPQVRWRDTQKQLRTAHLFWNRSALSLWLNSDEYEPAALAAASVAFSPDFTQATVQQPLPYVTMQADEELQPVSLLYTAVYRRIDDRWLLSPPDEAFWGDAVTISGKALTLIVPARDETVGRQLAADLDSFVHQLCQEEDLQCPGDFQLELELETDIDSLLGLNRSYRLRTIYRSDSGRIFQMRLPTPTLVGLPADEAAYQALYRGYAAQIGARILVNVDPTARIFGLDEPSPFAVRLRSLGLLPPRPTDYHPIRELTRPPIPYPDQDIVAFCRNGASPVLMRYDLAQAEWGVEYMPATGFLNQLIGLDGDGVLATISPATNDPGWRVEWINQGQAFHLFSGESARFIPALFPSLSGSSNKQHVFQVLQVDEDEQDQLPAWRLLDTAVCQDGRCPLESVEPMPFTSPAGSHELMLTLAGQLFSPYMIDFPFLLERNGNGEEAIALVDKPIWLDEQTVMYIRLESGETWLETAVVQPDGLQVTQQVTPAAFMAQAPDDEQAESLGIIGIAASASTPSQVVVVTLFTGAEERDSGVSLFRYDASQQQITPLAPPDAVNPIWYADMNRNGRYLGVVEATEFFQNPHLWLYDLEADSWQRHDLSDGVRNGAFFNWSADNRWLMLMGDDTVRLIAPEINYEKEIFFNFTSCESAVWVNR